MKRYIYIYALLLVLTSCDNGDDVGNLRFSGFKGIWTIEQVYANDHWGGPLHWSNTDWGKQIKLTSNEYYEKIDSDFELIGTYKIISDTKIEITWDEPIVPEYAAYQLDYEFDRDGHLTLFRNQYEGVVGEKYKLTEKLD